MGKLNPGLAKYLANKKATKIGSTVVPIKTAVPMTNHPMGNKKMSIKKGGVMGKHC